MPKKKRKRRDLGRLISRQNAIAALAHLENDMGDVSANCPATFHQNRQSISTTDREDDVAEENKEPGVTQHMGDLHLDNQTIFDDSDIDQDIPAFDDTDDDELTDNDRHDIATVQPIDIGNSSMHIDRHDEAMLDLLKLCQDAGTSLEFFDKLVCTLRKHGKNGFDITKASKRKTFLDRLRKNIPSCPLPEIAVVASNKVPKFKFLDQLMDLMQSYVFDKVENLCVNPEARERFSMYKSTETDSYSEVCSSTWYKDTYDMCIRKHGTEDQDFLLPLIFYIDETGTDAFQRYPLEPLMFTVGIIRRNIREQAGSWRHAGFIPKIGKYTVSRDGLQAYHDCISVILREVIDLQKVKPVVELTIGGVKQKVRLVLEVVFIQGDQKSQDKLCGRINANGGGAGRVHRGCMCSSLHASDATRKCQSVSKSILDRLRDISFESISAGRMMNAVNTHCPLSGRINKKKHKIAKAFVERRARLARDILGRTYTMHAICNAWDKVSFGCNKNGQYTATLDDPLHFCNSGMFQYMGQVGYLGMQDKEREVIEKVVMSEIRGVRSSIRHLFPRGRYANGFSNMTLLTADEKVGMNFTMLLALHNNQAKKTVEKSFQRQQKKYLTFEVPSKNKRSSTGTSECDNENSDIGVPTGPDDELQFPKRNHMYFAKEGTDKNFWPRTKESCDFILHHLKRHGFSFLFHENLDSLQLEYLFEYSWASLKSIVVDEDAYPDENEWRTVLGGYPYTQSTTTSSKTPQSTHIEAYCMDRLYHKPVGYSMGFISQEASPSDIPNLDEDGDYVSPMSSKITHTDGAKKKVDTHTIEFEHLRKGNIVAKHKLIKPPTKGVGNTSAILCDVETYADFLEISLCLHAYLHYSVDLPLSIRSDVKIFERGIREFVRLFAKYFYRGDSSVDSDTCKVHCFLHITGNTMMYGDPMQYESGKGERGLKDWAKSVSITAQKIGLDIFLQQTIMRVSDRLLISKALDMVVRQKATSTIDETTPDLDVGNFSIVKRKVPHYRLNVTKNTLVKLDRLGKSEDVQPGGGTILQNITSALQTFEKDMDMIHIWCEIKQHPEQVCEQVQGQLLRAHPCLDGFGAYYDWGEVWFDVSGAADSRYLAPVKFLAFYTDTEHEECAIVHSVEWTTDRESSLGNTRLIKNYQREFQSSGWPSLRKIKVSDIHQALYVIERKKTVGPIPPRTLAIRERKEYIVSVVTSRKEWALILHKWARDEVLPFADEKEDHCCLSETDSSSC